VDPKAFTIVGKAFFAMLTVAVPAWATAYAQAKIGTAGIDHLDIGLPPSTLTNRCNVHHPT